MLHILLKTCQTSCKCLLTLTASAQCTCWILMDESGVPAGAVVATQLEGTCAPT